MGTWYGRRLSYGVNEGNGQQEAAHSGGPGNSWRSGTDHVDVLPEATEKKILRCEMWLVALKVTEQS